MSSLYPAFTVARSQRAFDMNLTSTSAQHPSPCYNPLLSIISATSPHRMYMKSIALFVAIYGRTALAALPPSCQDGDSGTSCHTCTPRSSEFEPPGVGQVWYSHCCTESETNTADPPVTDTKEYCYSYSLKGYPSNQQHGMKPTCSENGSGNLAWTLEGQCKKDGVSSCECDVISILYVHAFIAYVSA